MNVDYRTIPQKDLAKFVLSEGGWSKLLCTGEKVRRLVDVALVFVGKEAKLQRRRQELTQTTPDQPVDDEAVYYKVAGDRPKGCVYRASVVMEKEEKIRRS
ncbi:hypothetical protein Scep_006700 [Stephania cephalantha]|uniref:Uncharacterized protein n=1 Tax=Stephania cephalantha TaxID=152367 RepID=A0AAP0K8D0_9MAGN